MVAFLVCSLCDPSASLLDTSKQWKWRPKYHPSECSQLVPLSLSLSLSPSQTLTLCYLILTLLLSCQSEKWEVRTLSTVDCSVLHCPASRLRVRGNIAHKSGSERGREKKLAQVQPHPHGSCPGHNHTVDSIERQVFCSNFAAGDFYHIIFASSPAQWEVHLSFHPCNKCHLIDWNTRKEREASEWATPMAPVMQAHFLLVPVNGC